MSGKQYISFRCRLLAVLFLFFNSVCTAAPVLKATSENYKQATSVRLAQNPNAAESEEECRLAVSYVIQLTSFSFKRQAANHPDNVNGNCPNKTLADMGGQESYLTATNFLSRPGYYTFLFRYKLF